MALNYRERQQFDEERLALIDDVSVVVKRLRAVLVSAEEAKGESAGLLVARLAQTHEMLGDVIEEARSRLTATPPLTTGGCIKMLVHVAAGRVLGKAGGWRRLWR